MPEGGKARSGAALAIFVALVALAGWIGSRFQPGAWYVALERPPLTPPSWLFGPVWSVLYLAIAVAGWRVWRRPSGNGALTLWGAQLALNALWSYLFFGLQRPGVALIEIVVLLAAVVATTVAFRRRDRVAGRLFVPYLAWVAFATYLNAGFWWLNR